MHTEVLPFFPIPVTRSVLECGLTIITAEIESVFAIAEVVIPTGSFSDGEHPGIAHFLEHVMLEGPARDGSHPRLRRFLRRGLGSNASTSSEYTKYYVHGLLAEVRDALPELMWIVFHPEFNETQVDSEREVVRQEIRDREVNREYSLWRARTLYPDVPCLQLPIGGSEESVGEIHSEELVRFHTQWYSPDRATLFVASNLAHDEVLAHVGVNAPFASPTPPPARCKFKPVLSRSEYTDARRPSLVEICFHQADEHRQRLIARIGLALLTHSKVGMLNHELRHKNQLVYQVGFEESEDTYQVLSLIAKTKPIHFARVEGVMRQWIDWIADGTYEDEAWETLLTETRLSVFSDIETWQHGKARRVKDMLIHHWKTDRWNPRETLEILDSVSPQEVADVARTHLNTTHCGVITVRPPARSTP